MDATGAELKAVVTASNLTTGALTVAPYTAANTAALATTGVKIFVFGSEYAKGSTTPNSTVTQVLLTDMYLLILLLHNSLTHQSSSEINTL